jgi:hypothetical protein
MSKTWFHPTLVQEQYRVLLNPGAGTKLGFTQPWCRKKTGFNSTLVQEQNWVSPNPRKE